MDTSARQLKESPVLSIEGVFDLLIRFEKCIEKLEAATKDLPKQAEERVLSFEQARQYIGVSKPHLYKLTSSAQIPHYKPQGKKIYFEKKELDNWLLRNRVKTVEEIESEAAAYVVLNRGKGI